MSAQAEQVDEAEDWRDLAACKDVDPDVFFPVGSDDDAAQAKAICAGCPVQAACREAGMGEKYGVWGGMTEWERRKVRMRRRLG